MPNARFACLAAAALAGAAALLATVREFATATLPGSTWLRAAWPDAAGALLVALSVALAAAALVAAVALSIVAAVELTRLTRKFELLSMSDEDPRPRLQFGLGASLLAREGGALLLGGVPRAERAVDRAIAGQSFRMLALLLLGGAVALSLARLAFADAAAPDLARLVLPPVLALLVVVTALLLSRWILLPLANDTLAAASTALAWGNSERAIARAEDHPAPLVEAIERLRGDVARWRDASFAADQERAQRLDTVLRELLAAVVQQRDAARGLAERLDAFTATPEPSRDGKLHEALSNFLSEFNAGRTGTNG